MGRRQSFAQLMSQLATVSGGKLYGRDAEEAELVAAYQRVVHDRAQELVLVAGRPGTGKTALVQRLRAVVRKNKHFMIRGKFEENTVLQPYQVFAAALTELIGLIGDAGSPDELASYQQRLQQAVGNDGRLLLEVIPALEQVLDMSVVAKSSGGAGYGSEKLTRFRAVFCSFLDAVCQIKPIVVCLDDLQWADTASMNLIRELMHYHPRMSLLMVGTHRLADDMKPTCKGSVYIFDLKPFRATLRELQRELPDQRITTINLVNLDVTAVNGLLSDLLNRDRERTMSLATVVVQHTNGNVFQVLQFLRLLVDQEYLYQNEHDQWMWDDDAIRDKLAAPGTIVEIVRKVLEGLSRIAQETLKVASCMGDEIDDSALDLVLQTSTGYYLDEAMREGLLIFVPQYGGYRFAQNWVREAAHELIPQDEREEFYLKIGRRLWKSSSPTILERNVVQVVSLLNKGSRKMTEERERYKVAELNLKAGQQAVLLASYSTAGIFLDKGIELLSFNRWIRYYDLSLALYSAAAEVELINGNFEKVKTYIQQVIESAHIIEDKLRCYATLLRAMAQQNDLCEAVNVGLDALKQLGEPLPGRPNQLAVLKELVLLKLALRGKRSRDLLKLPLMTNKRKIASLEFLNLMSQLTYRTRSPYFVITAIRSVMLTLRYGLHKESGTAFAVYGMVLCGPTSDFKAGYRLGQLAISMAEQTKNNKEGNTEAIAMVYFLNGVGIMHWSKAIREDSLEALLYSSKLAMEYGHVELALTSRLARCMTHMFSGGFIDDTKLELLEIKQMATLYRNRATLLVVVAFRKVINFFQASTITLEQVHESLTSATEVLLSLNNKAYGLGLYYFGLEANFLAGDYARAARMSVSKRELLKRPSPHNLSPSIRFKEALVAIAMARSGVHGSWAKDAQRDHAFFKKWATASPRSYLGKERLIRAERMSLKPRYQRREIMAMYEQSIELSRLEGYLDDAALAYERASCYDDSLGNDESAKQLRERAAALYEEWGAVRKSQELRAVGFESNAEAANPLDLARQQPREVALEQ